MNYYLFSTTNGKLIIRKNDQVLPFEYTEDGVASFWGSNKEMEIARAKWMASCKEIPVHNESIETFKTLVYTQKRKEAKINLDLLLKVGVMVPKGNVKITVACKMHDNVEPKECGCDLPDEMNECAIYVEPEHQWPEVKQGQPFLCDGRLYIIKTMESADQDDNLENGQSIFILNPIT